MWTAVLAVGVVLAIAILVGLAILALLAIGASYSVEREKKVGIVRDAVRDVLDERR